LVVRELNRAQSPETKETINVICFTKALSDFDGTLVATVYAHVLAWQGALGEVGVDVDRYRLHRHVGSSGKLIIRCAPREAGRQLAS
jgi:beta-phosphoglucomutase-like phosphatase (HAD superfamily)